MAAVAAFLRSVVCFTVLLLLIPSNVAAQRPDVVYFKDSVRLAGTVTQVEGTAELYLYEQGKTKRRLLPRDAVRILQYNPQSGRLVRTLHGLPTADGSARFVVAKQHLPTRYWVYSDLTDQQWLYSPEISALLLIPREKDAYRTFVGKTIPEQQLPAINGHKALRAKRRNVGRLAGLLNNRSERYAAASWSLSWEYTAFRSVTNVFDTRDVRYGLVDIRGFQGSSIYFQPNVISRVWSVSVGRNFPLSVSGRADLTVALGYSKQNTTGLGSTATGSFGTLESAVFGDVGSALFTSSLNYRFTQQRWQPFVGAGLLLRQPVDGELKLYSYSLRGTTVYDSPVYTARPSLSIGPRLSVGGDYPLTRGTWVTLAGHASFLSTDSEKLSSQISASLTLNY